MRRPSLIASWMLSLLVGGSLPGSLAAQASNRQGASCEPSWLPTFGGQPGVEGEVFALTVYDDGRGPALCIGGDFVVAGNVAAHGIALWDGAVWSTVGAGVDGDVRALAVMDDGQGPALYAGGNFTTAGDVTALGIAKWDGSSWSALGAGVDWEVHALAVMDDGQGPALFAGGNFLSAGGVTVNRIARWDGATWSALGSGMSGGAYGPDVTALAVFDDGSGPALYAGGMFTSADGVAANALARWDGTNWSSLGSGMGVGNGASVLALTVFDDGSGPALHAAGSFSTAGGTAASNVAKWDGSSWSALGSGLMPWVTDLAVFDDGGGPALYAGGYFTSTGSGLPANKVAKWNGASWSEVGSVLNGPVHALAVFDDGGGAALCAGGHFFTLTTGETANSIASWDGSSWSVLPGGGLNGAVDALAVFDDGNGPALFVGGSFTSVSDGFPASEIARWDGTSWSALGSGMVGYLEDSCVDALAVFDDGGGTALYAGGRFFAAGGASASNIAKWDGSSWSSVGGGVGPDGDVRAFAVFDDGSGQALYAGGSFTTAGGVAAKGIAKWDGATWSALGSGIEGGSYSTSVNTLAVFDDGSGPALYAGGDFTMAGGLEADSIAKWDGSSWSATLELSPYLSQFNALVVFDDGGGPALYAAGSVDMSGTIMKWDGTTWSLIGGAYLAAKAEAALNALTVFDDGSGPVLCAGGVFVSAGGTSANSITTWDGASWSTLGGGMQYEVRALATFDDGSGPALYAGGSFSALDSADSNLAKWGCPAPYTPWKNLGHALAGQSGKPALEGTGSLQPDTLAEVVLTGANPTAPAWLVVSPTAVNLPFKGGTLVPSPTAVLPLPVDAAGQITLALAVPASLPSGSIFFMQYWITDLVGPDGFSASNALMATLP